MILLRTSSGITESASFDQPALSSAICLGLRWRGVVHWLPSNCTEYSHGKMGSASFLIDVVDIEGYWLSCKKGGMTIRMRFYERSGYVTTEVDNG